MPRVNSSNWSVNDQVTAARVQDINEDLDDLYSKASDRLRVVAAASGTPLRIDIGAGNAMVGQTHVQYAGATDTVVTDAATNYVEIDSSGTIQINTSGWTTSPSTLGRLATVVCAGGVITGITLYRTDAVGGLDLITSVSKFGDGSDGALNITSGTTSLDCTATSGGILVKQYTSFNISAGATMDLTNVPSSGVTLIFLVQDDFTVAGTLDGRNGGSAGGGAVSASRTSDGNTANAGNAGTNCDAGVSLGQARNGGAGAANTASEGGADSDTAASAGGSGGNSVTDGTASSSATGGSASAGAGTAGLSLTTSLLKLVANMFPGYTLSCGCGGGSGGAAVRISGYLSGTISATGVAGGRGAASVIVICGGDFSMTGTVNLAGTAASGSTSTTMANRTGANSGESASVGGSSGGAAGNFLAQVKGTITNSGTYTLTGGAGVAGTNNQQGTGDGSTSAGGKSDGATGAAGTSGVCKIF